MTPGETVRGIRIELDLSLREVAAAAGLTHVRLGEIERDVAGVVPDGVLLALFVAMAKLVEPRAAERAAEFTAKLRRAGL